MPSFNQCYVVVVVILAASFGQAFDEIVVESTLMVKGKSASGAAAAREGRGQSSATLVNNATDGVRVQGLRSSHKIE